MVVAATDPRGSDYEFRAAALARIPLPVPGVRLSQHEIDAALLDPCVFTDRHCKIRGASGRPEAFRLWPFQVATMMAMRDEMRLLVLKARQLGISWCADAFALWLCTANPGQTVLMLSRRLDDAIEEMRRVRFMHERLPPELRRRTGAEVPESDAPDTMTHLEFPDMDSRIISLPTTEHAGTSYTATLVIVQELAKIKQASALMEGLTPTIGDSGRMFLVSTARGYGGVFANYWRSVQHRWHTGQIVGEPGELGDFRPVFIPWYMRPGRTQRWYDAMARTLLGEGKSDRAIKQEYPGEPKDAFQGGAETVFAEEFDRHGPYVVDSTREPTNPYDVVTGLDPGVNIGCAYLIEVQGRVAFVFDEIYLQNKSVEALGQAVAERLAAHGLDPAGCMTYVDPYAVGRNLQTLKNDYEVIGEQGLLVDQQNDRYLPEQRVSLMKSLFLQARLFISLDCPRLIDAFEQAPWAMKRAQSGEEYPGETYDKDGKHEHPLDAVGTALARIYPPITAAAVETQPPQFGGAYAYSQSEFG